MHQLSLPSRPTWGGCRRGAGRKRVGPRRRVPHAPRVEHDPRCPVHVTVRARSDVVSLRRAAVFPAVRCALAASSTARFRLIQFTVQADHLHLIVEADEPGMLRCGMQGLAIRVARAVNRVLHRRGSVWADRFHARELRTPREVRSGIVYVLQNHLKHVAGACGVDPCSSAPWFRRWRTGPLDRAGPAPVARAHTWLASVGWARYGPLSPSESPRRAAGPWARARRRR